ncbi:MAG TPA: beta-ketoacyl-[acyl-carrier-protein] synthase family protein [Burkholderiaceae bacterium]|nr:beta-ketoacyl-[acyl-carrier-protein] synthase family protein [Burkholderiaceae bacterium]
MRPVAIADYTVTSAIGTGRRATLASLEAGRTGLRPQSFETASLRTWLGEVPGVEEQALPSRLQRYDCRNHRLAWLALQADDFAQRVRDVRAHVGASRIGVFLGTSTSGIFGTEQAYRRRDPLTGALPVGTDYAHTHNVGSLAAFVREALALQGPACVISTACSSAAKAYATGARMLAQGLVDAAVVGGVDSFCLTTLHGFDSLELLSPEICRPWDARRRGLSLGEGAAFALLERASRSPRGWLLGAGETSDGHHMSSPHPTGAGAAEAMRQALAAARLDQVDVDYLNLHGTGTSGNDAVEDMAVRSVFRGDLPCSSTKGATGHTLGAAGGVEAAISLLALEHGLMPGGLNRAAPDPALGVRYLDAPREARLDIVASNSFGFGGSNVCLVFGARAA